MALNLLYFLVLILTLYSSLSKSYIVSENGNSLEDLSFDPIYEKLEICEDTEPQNSKGECIKGFTRIRSKNDKNYIKLPLNFTNDSIEKDENEVSDNSPSEDVLEDSFSGKEASILEPDETSYPDSKERIMKHGTSHKLYSSTKSENTHVGLEKIASKVDKVLNQHKVQRTSHKRNHHTKSADVISDPNDMSPRTDKGVHSSSHKRNHHANEKGNSARTQQIVSPIHKPMNPHSKDKTIESRGVNNQDAETGQEQLEVNVELKPAIPEETNSFRKNRPQKVTHITLKTSEKNRDSNIKDRRKFDAGNSQRTEDDTREKTQKELNFLKNEQSDFRVTDVLEEDDNTLTGRILSTVDSRKNMTGGSASISNNATVQGNLKLTINEHIPKTVEKTTTETAQESLPGSLKVLLFNQSVFQSVFQEAIHWIKTDRNVQAYVLNVLLLYVPILICDFLLWLVIFRLLCLIHRQFVFKRSNPSEKKQALESRGEGVPPETVSKVVRREDANDKSAKKAWFPPK